MKRKMKRLLTLTIILTSILTLTFGLVAYGEGDKLRDRDRDYQECPDRDRIRDRNCTGTCECINDCCCCLDCLKARLRQGMIDEEIIEEVIRYQGLKENYNLAKKTYNTGAVEEIAPELEQSRLRIHEFVKNMKEEVKKLQLRVQQFVQNRCYNRGMYQWQRRINFIEEEIEIIEIILE